VKVSFVEVFISWSGPLSNEVSANFDLTSKIGGGGIHVDDNI